MKNKILDYLKDFIIIMLQSSFLMLVMAFLIKYLGFSYINVISVLCVWCVIPVYYFYKKGDKNGVN
jgi:uncharacterized membrane protein